MRKKVWSKPELVVLTRARRGETVLVTCKAELMTPTAGDTADIDCFGAFDGGCTNCFSYSGT